MTLSWWHRNECQGAGVPEEDAMREDLAELEQCFSLRMWRQEPRHDQDCCLIACWSPWHAISNN